MSITVENALPPNVRGKCRGIFEISIRELIWSSKNDAIDGSSTIRSTNNPIRKGKNSITSCIGSGGISIQLIWWGETIKTGAIIKLNKPTINDPTTAIISKSTKENGKESHSIEYTIKTRSELFQNYLKNCEPIDIKFTSNTSNLQIGTSYARIPLKIINNCGKTIGQTFEEIGKYKIFSPRNNCLGNITLVFKMLFYAEHETNTKSFEKMLSINRSIDIALKENLNKLNVKELIVNGSNELNLKGLETARSYKSYRSDCNDPNLCVRNRLKSDRCISSSSLSSNMMNYLTGQKMSRNDEEKALQEIRCTSPIGSVVNELMNSNHSVRDNTFNRVDSLRLFVKTLNLTAAGVREVSIQSLANITFTIECRISPNLLDNVRAKYDYDVMRFYSDHFDDRNKRIDFNRDAIRSIKIARNEFDSSIVEHSNLMFTIWWREFGSKHSRCLGTAKYRFTSLFEALEFEQTKKLAVRSCTGNIHVADIIAKVTLGTKGVHFGPDFMAIIKDNNYEDTPLAIDETPSSEILTPDSFYSSNIFMTTPNFRSHNKDDTSKNTNNENSTGNKSNTVRSNVNTAKSNQTTQTPALVPNKNLSYEQNSEQNQIGLDKKLENESQILLQGLLFVGSVRNVQPLSNGGYFLVCRAFWKEDATSTEFCEDNNFNFLEIFPIINDERFLERTRNNHLIVELWQKTVDSPEQMVGLAKFPLHQFYIAFRDSAITKHLCQTRLPVISIDGWVPISSPLSMGFCGQLQGLLAIGTEEQLEYLKASRGLNFNRVSKVPTFNSSDIQIPVPLVPKQLQTNITARTTDAESQTTDDFNENTVTTARRERLSDLLGTFIDNLAQRLPSDRAQTLNFESPILSNETNILNQHQEPQVRQTSELLDVLQKALITPPTSMGLKNANGSIPIDFLKNVPVQPNLVHLPPTKSQNFFKILLEIESALHLPRNPLKLGNKKCSKRNSNTGKCKQSRFPADEEPSVYVTFQAEEGFSQMIKSHEGLVYATNVSEKTCSPVWGKRFEIFVPVDLLTNDEKRFILKVWRKAASDLPQCRLLPNPLEDSVIGFAAIDLNVLLVRMPCISGWFNIVDFNGRINGQIKVNVQPLEDVLKFKESLCCNKNENQNKSTANQFPVTMAPLSLDLENTGTAGVEVQNTTLSRAIKRKFTELEEITQRLKARLFDVTGEAEATIGDTVVDAQMDEFERDLNTTCEEDENNEISQDFDWLGNASISDDGQSLYTSTSSDPQERIQIISECLRKTDLNESRQSTQERNPPEGGAASSCTKRID